MTHITIILGLLQKFFANLQSVIFDLVEIGEQESILST